MKWNNKFTYPKSIRSIINGSRHYNLEDSNLPSVTTILKATQSEEDKAGIAAWKERVGYKEAERIKMRPQIEEVPCIFLLNNFY